MSRVKQNRVIDNAIRSIAVITQNQCSLSETDLKVIAEVSSRLQLLKKKKGKTNEQICQEIVNVVLLLIRFFSKDCNDDGQMPKL
ncbi:hypothetical protein Q4E93_29585 [Flavitalea sp. BT771]|uniref:hypothetical protein n=1 Tax=Flavitalea sp. BT771 TaxID=3063329 RepID=UPI0026E2880F|nr:hypothetical protein [Flavitalea sp. BT771]MDO6434801.1 hypothetical protein [Flavitalea sp. BT771]MDV6223701.1 hypothetical protein [Flavitalea sp. BT771]